MAATSRVVNDVGYYLLMAEQRVLSPEQIAELAGRLAALHWSWSVSELDRVVGELGWTMARGPRSDTNSAVVQTGLPVFDGFADVRLLDEVGMGAILVRVSQGGGNGEQRATEFLRDVFATTVRAVDAGVGQPMERRPGADPEVLWPAASGVLRVRQGSLFVELALLSNGYAELEDLRRTEPIDDDYLDGGW